MRLSTPYHGPNPTASKLAYMRIHAPATRRRRRFRLLHLAAFEGSVDTVLLLLSAGASVNAQDLDGWTPLMYVMWLLVVVVSSH